MYKIGVMNNFSIIYKNLLKGNQNTKKLFPYVFTILLLGNEYKLTIRAKRVSVANGRPREACVYFVLIVIHFRRL